MPQRTLLGALLFLIYVNYMSMAVKCNLFLYASDTFSPFFLVFQSKNVKGIEKQVNEDFANMCHWFVNSKLNIHFGEDKTKSILFTFKTKKLQKLEVIYNNIRIKQHSPVTYLGCILEETMSGESMAHKVISKVNARLKFLREKKKHLTPNLRRVNCNALIQPHFDYADSAWYPNLSKKLKNKIETSQNKSILFRIQLDKMSYISQKHFETVNWLPSEEKYK